MIRNGLYYDVIASFEYSELNIIFAHFSISIKYDSVWYQQSLEQGFAVLIIQFPIISFISKGKPTDSHYFLHKDGFWKYFTNIRPIQELCIRM